MNKDKIIEMIDTHLEEPHSISQEWVDALETCRQALIENENLKAEIDRLNVALSVQKAFNLTKPETVEEVAKYYISNKDTIRAEAIKEFAERLKDMSEDYTDFGHPYVLCKDVDYLVKEMVGEV